MKVLFLDKKLTIYLIPREIPSVLDNLSLTLRNESTDLIITPNFSYYIDPKHIGITITEQPTDFKIGNKYEITLLNEDKIIYLGKLQILKEDTSVQNFNYEEQGKGFY